MVNGINDGIYGAYGGGASYGIDGSLNDEEKKNGKSSPEECETCKNRK